MAQEYRRDKDARIQEVVVQALLDRADLLHRQGNPDEAIAHYDDIIDRLTQGDFNFMRDLRHNAAESKAAILCKRGDYDGAIATYEALGWQWKVAETLLAKGDALFEQENFYESIVVFNAIVERFGTGKYENRSAFRDLVDLAREDKIRSLLDLEQFDAVIAIHDGFDRPVEAFETLRMKGDALRAHGNHKEAIEAYEELLARANHARLSGRLVRIDANRWILVARKRKSATENSLKRALRRKRVLAEFDHAPQAKKKRDLVLEAKMEAAAREMEAAAREKAREKTEEKANAKNKKEKRQPRLRASYNQRSGSH